jgi:GT2 family glycosyltransferase
LAVLHDAMEYDRNRRRTSRVQVGNSSEAGMSFSIGVINYNTVDDVIACLASLHGATADEVIVVDSASSDDSVARVRQAFPDVTLIVSPANRGYGAAANLAIARCRSQYLLLLNSDTLVPERALETLERYLDEHPRAAIVGPRIDNPDGSLQPSCFGFPSLRNVFLRETRLGSLTTRLPVLRSRHLANWTHDQPRRVGWVRGAALALRVDAIRAIGGFDERFFMYSEEVDLSRRALDAGWETHFAPVTRIVHFGATSTQQARAAMALEFTRSSMRYYRLHERGLRLTALLALVRFGALIKLVRDTVLRWRASDPLRRSQLDEDRGVWRRILLHGDRQADHLRALGWRGAKDSGNG